MWLVGHLKPTAAGMRLYHKYLGLFIETDPQKLRHLHFALCRGWYIGTVSGKKAIMKDVSEGVVRTPLIRTKSLELTCLCHGLLDCLRKCV